MILRAGEEKLTCDFFRSERVVQINKNWYFLTRGGERQGPFLNQAEALTFLQMFLSRYQHGNALSTAGATKNRKASTPSRQTNVIKPAFNVRRIAFTAVAEDVSQVCEKAAVCANDSFNLNCP